MISDEHKTYHSSIRMSKTTKEALQRIAKSAGYDHGSSYLRLVLEQLIAANPDDANPNFSPAPKLEIILPPEIPKLSANLSIISNNINQIARGLNTRKDSITMPELQENIEKTLKIIEQIRPTLTETQKALKNAVAKCTTKEK